MKTCFLCTGAYTGTVAARGWPVPPELCEREEAAKSYDAAIRNCQLAETAGFDWVSISEHHYAPGLMTPNPIVLAAALAQATSRVKIALLGPLVPLVNPVRTAEEIAMLDALSHGRVVVLFLRGTPNEHHTYGGIAPDATRTITQEGVQLIRKAWTEPKPFAWEGEHFQFKTVSVWPRTVQDPHPQISIPATATSRRSSPGATIYPAPSASPAWRRSNARSKSTRPRRARRAGSRRTTTFCFAAA